MYEGILMFLLTYFVSAKSSTEEIIIMIISASTVVSVVSIVVTIVICCKRRCCRNDTDNLNTQQVLTRDEQLRQNLIPPLFFTQDLPDPLEQDDLVERI